MSERLTIAEKVAAGLRLNEREWREWLAVNWQPLHQTLANISGRRVQYGVPVDGYRTNMGPNGSGVYFLFNGDRLQYVGKATSISHRLWRHFVEKNIAWDCVSWIEVISDAAEEVEHFYIYELKPPCNRRHLSRGHLMRELVQRSLG